MAQIATLTASKTARVWWRRGRMMAEATAGCQTNDGVE